MPVRVGDIFLPLFGVCECLDRRVRPIMRQLRSSIDSSRQRKVGASGRRSICVVADYHSGYISVDDWLESMRRLSPLLRVALIVPSIFLGAELLSGCAVSSTPNTTVAPATIGLVTGT